MKRFLLLILILLPMLAFSQAPVSPVKQQDQVYTEPSTHRVWDAIAGRWYLRADSAYIKQIAGPGFTNPMTTAGDIIVGGSGGAPLRMAMGAGSTGGGGINNTFLTVNPTGTGLEYKALFSGAGLAGSFSQGNLLLFLKDNTVISTNANISSTDLSALTLFELPTITANRTIDVGGVSNYTGQRITFWNKNTSGFTWSFIGATVVSPAGVSALTVPSNSIVQIQSDGTQWVATVSPQFSFSNGLTNTSGTVKLGGTLTDFTVINANNNPFLLQNSDGSTNTTVNIGTSQLDFSAAIPSGNHTDIDVSTSGISLTALNSSGSNQGTISVSKNSFNLQAFTGSQSGISFGPVTTGINVQDQIQGLGFLYDADYSVAGKVFDRWIPDWGTVKDYIASSVPTIYTGNGSLSSNRTVNLNGFTLGFNGNISVSGAILGRGAGADSSSFGYGVFKSTPYTTGKANVYFGGRALQSNTTGTSNTAIGVGALTANTTGIANTSVGTSSLTANTTGNSNDAFGESSLTANTTGSFNTAFGRSTLRHNTTGNANVAVGLTTLTANTTGVQNTAIGEQSENTNTTGSFNVAVGQNSLYRNVTGNGNTAIGDSSLFNVLAGNNTAVGRAAGLSNTGSGNLFLGYNAGFNETGSNTLYIANSSTNQPLIKGDFSAKTVLINGVIGTASTPLGTAGTDSIVVKHGNNFYAISPTGGGSGTVTSITPGYGFTSSTPITTSGTIIIDTASQIASAANHPTFSQLQTKVNGYVPTSTTVAGFALSSNVSLAALTATDASLTFSGSYNGSTARTVGINFAQTPTWTGLHTFNQAGNATTSADVISVGTSTVATSGVPQQYSGGVNIFGYGWNTGGTPASHIMNFRMQVEPQTGSVDLGYLRFLGSTNGGAYSNLFTISTAGNFVVPAGNFTLNKGFIAAVSTDGLVLDGVAAATVGNPIQKSTRVREQAGIWNTKATAATNYSSISFDMSGISSNAPVGKLAYYGGLSTTTTVTQTEIMDLFHYGAISLLPQAATINAWANNTEASATGAILNIGGATLTDGITAASTTLTYGFGSSISQPTFAATNTGEVITNAATLHVGPAPAAGTNVTITNGYSGLFDGNTRFNAGILQAGSSSGVISILTQAAAGTYNFNLPITAGNAGQVLTSQAGSATAMTWSSTPIIQTTADLTAQTAAVTVGTFTVGASTATFNLSGYINITAVTVDVIELQATYTDENSTSQTVTFFNQGATSALLSSIGNSTYPPVLIRAKNGTVITVKTTLTTGTGSIAYDAGARINQL